MHLSTSSSNAAVATAADRQARAFFARVVIAICVMLAVEATTRLVLVAASNVQRQNEAALRAALRLSSNTQHPSVLIVGNSLLLRGIKADSLRAKTSPELEVQPLAIAMTVYFDWLYGLRHLWSSGSRPDVVAAMLPRVHLLNPKFRGPYSVFRLVDSRDIPSLARDLRVHRTISSGYYLAEVSSFYAMRSDLRNIFLERMVPRMDLLASVFGGYGRLSERIASPALDTLSLARERLRRMKQEVEAMGERFLWIIPPSGVQSATFNPTTDLCRRAAREEGVEVFEIEETDPYPASAYGDGFHLNEWGAQRYTFELSRELLRRYGR